MQSGPHQPLQQKHTRDFQTASPDRERIPGEGHPKKDIHNRPISDAVREAEGQPRDISSKQNLEDPSSRGQGRPDEKRKPDQISDAK
jgi:hypothetical protein